MPKIMEIIEKETKGKSYHTYKMPYLIKKENKLNALIRKNKSVNKLNIILSAADL